MVLKGEFKNELGNILQKDKIKEEVTVQLDEDSGL
jgi:transcription antitermination factor NusG